MALHTKGLRNRILATGAWFTGVVGTLAALSLSWWWKIDELRSPQDVPQAALMQKLDVGRLWLTPVAVKYHNEGGGRRIVLETLLENRTGSTQTALFGAPARLPKLLAGDQPLPDPEVILSRDQERLTSLQPRMPEQVQFIWTIENMDRGQNLSVEFSKQTFKLQDNLYGQSSWLGSSVAAVLPLPRE